MSYLRYNLSMTSPDFKTLIYEYVAQIPSGHVMTYGQLAALAEHPRAARIVGGIAHFGPEYLPWHRVVNKQGRLASAFPGGRSAQAQLLSSEGVNIRDEHVINIGELLWNPHQ
jgi:methylated-DNA-protein-cysteine methyltransferase-like protein